MARQDVSLEELFSILDQEFKRSRSSDCRSCITPLPIRRAAPDDVSTNWFVVEPQDCPHHCRTKLAEIVLRLMSEYELERSVYGVRRSARNLTS